MCLLQSYDNLVGFLGRPPHRDYDLVDWLDYINGGEGCCDASDRMHEMYHLMGFWRSHATVNPNFCVVFDRNIRSHVTPVIYSRKRKLATGDYVR
jgi:hypothetical protein